MHNMSDQIEVSVQHMLAVHWGTFTRCMAVMTNRSPCRFKHSRQAGSVHGTGLVWWGDMLGMLGMLRAMWLALK